MTSQEPFSQLVILLSQSLLALHDDFFVQKITRHIQTLITVHLQSHNVAQYYLLELIQINSLIETLETISHLNLGNKKQITLAYRLLLEYKLYLIQNKKSNQRNPIKKAEPAAKKPQHKLNSTQEKIISFIKRMSESRAKEIINEFSLFSERTVKRNLKELTSAGLLEKKIKDNATFYLAKS
ncbi:hypothetical protein KW791_01155 [Candidatus Parcubacteria bacterium]|nr:hypothetical protein [Candidatus Parcubacteria bacterium]